MTTPLATRTDHWDAVDRLVNPTRRKLIRDNGHAEHVTIPSLFDQLIEAMESGAGSNHRGVQASKPPLDTSALSLLIEIADTVVDGCLQRKIKRKRDTPLDLRQLTSAINTEGNPDTIDACTLLVRSWCARIVATISNDPDRSWRMYKAACTTCGSTEVPCYTDDGQEARQPALIVYSQDGRITAIRCDFCGSTLDEASMLDKIAAASRDPDARPVRRGDHIRDTDRQAS